MKRERIEPGVGSQVLECLWSVHEALGLISITGVVCDTIPSDLVIRRWQQGDERLQVA